MKRAMRLLAVQLLAIAAIGLPVVGSQATQVSAAEVRAAQAERMAQPARIVIGPGWGSCPAGYACLWEHAHAVGRGVGFYNREPDFNTLPPPYRFIQDTASSVYNNGTSGRRILLCQHAGGGGRCVTLAMATAFPNLANPRLSMNDMLSSLSWISV